MNHSTMFLSGNACSQTIDARIANWTNAFVLALMLVLWGGSSAIAQSGECTPSLSVICPANVSLECGNENNLELAGAPVVSGEFCDLSVSMIHSDAIISNDGCAKVIARTWTITLGDLSELCVQTISVSDTQGPIISGLDATLHAQCEENLPAYQVPTTTDCSMGDITVENFDSESGGLLSDCSLATANGPGADWGVWLPVLANNGVTASAYFVFDAAGGHFEQYIDGTAHLFGTVMNSTNNNQKFIVDLWFENKRDWAQWSALGRSYKNDLGLACATGDHINWSYYELVNGFSTLTGAGDLAGDVLYLNHLPVNYYFGFQLGTGANNKNCNYGLSGWFTYSGVVNGQDVSGNGDVNVDASCNPVSNPNIACQTEFTYLYRATDACGNASVFEQLVIVDDTQAPVFSNCPEAVTIQCSDALPALANPTATDNCTGDVTITYLGETSSGNLCSTVITRTWEAVDACGNRAMCQQQINVVDTTAPVLNGLPTESVNAECSNVPAAAVVTASDNCSAEVVVNYNESIEAGNCPGNYTIVRTWSASDDCQNVASFTQTVQVADNTAPVFDAYEIYTSAPCETMPGALTASDNCGEVSVVLLSEQLNSGGCLGTLYRVYQATDACGNTATAEQYIAIQDLTAPTLENVPAEATLECSDVAQGANGNYFDATPVTAVDNCGGDVTIAYSEEVVGTDDNCPNSYDIVRTWVATDYCENQTSASQTIHVIDTTNPYFTSFPADATVSCDQELPAVVYPTAADNCDGDVSIEMAVTESPGECAQERFVTRTFRAYDDCGNEFVQAQTIHVIDETAPVFGENQDDFIYECNTEIAVVQPVASDNCSENLTYGYNDGGIEGNSCESYFVRTWTATDECGNSSSFSQIIHIVDTTNPVISGDVEVNRPCDDFGGNYITVSDNCNEVSISYEEFAASGSCAGIIVRTYTATDACGNSSTFEQIINLIDEVAPAIASETADFTVECGDAYEVAAPVFADNCDQELDVVSDMTSEFDGCSTVETYTWTATDHCGNQTTATTVVTIEDTTNPSFVSVPADTTISCDAEIPAAVTPAAIDNCDDQVDVYVSEEAMPGSCPQAQTIYRVFRGIDNCGNQVVETQTITIIDITAPVFDEQAFAFTYECSDEIPVVQPTAVDNCSSNLTYTYEDGAIGSNLRAPSANGNGNNLVAICHQTGSGSHTIYVNENAVNAHLSHGDYLGACNEDGDDDDDNDGDDDDDNDGDDDDDNDGDDDDDNDGDDDDDNDGDDNDGDDDNGDDSTGDPSFSEECDRSFVRTWTVTDECGNSSTFTQVIRLVDTTAPVFAGDVQFSINCEEYSADGIYVTATDNCQEATITLVSNMEVSGSCAGSYIRVYRAEDGCGNASEFTQYISVIDNVAPTGNEPQDIVLSCDQEIPAFDPAFADNCDANIVVTHNLPERAGYCSQSITETWTAEDQCGNITTIDRVITFVDETAPVFSYVPASYQSSCDAELVFESATATDNCDTEVSILVEEVIEAGSCPQAYTLTRLFIATDECGNTEYASQTISVVDETAPVFGEQQASYTYECSAEIPVVQPTATDNCSENIAYTYADGDATGNSCASSFARTWTATDECGNASTFVQAINTEDTTAPVVDAYDMEITMPCDDINTASLISATDNCSEVIITHEDMYASGACAGMIIRTYSIQDACGNVTEGLYQQFITLIDVTAPVVAVAPENVTIECGSTIPGYVPDWSDNCDDALVISSTEDVAFEGCNQIITQSFTAVDHCNNTTTVSRTITIVDTTSPWFDAIPADHAFDCADEITVDVVTASDACDDEVEVNYADEIVAGNCPSNYTIIRVWRANDDCGNEVVHTQTITVSDNNAPVFTFVPEGGAYECSVGMPGDMATAEDNCSELTLSYSDVSVPGSIGDPNGGDNGDCGTHKTFTQGGWGATPNGNNPGVYLHANFSSAYPNGVVIGCGSNTLVFETAQEITGFLPSGGTPSALPNSSVLAGQLLAATLNVGFDAYDASFGNSSVALGEMEFVSGTFQGMNVNQVLAIANDVIGGCSSAYSASAVNNALTVINENFDNGTQDNGNLDCGSTGNPNDVCGIEITRTWTATDACGNTSTATTVYFIYDNTAPVFDQTFENVSVSCVSEMPAPINATATDACSATTVTMTTETVESDDCGNQIMVVRYSAVDECGNEARAFYTITVNDDEAPVLSGCPSDVQLACSDEVPAAATVTAMDNCGGETEVTFEEFIIGELPAAGSIADCDLITPARPANNSCAYPYDWAMALFGMPNAHRWFAVSEGNFVQYPDGSATMNAVMTNVLNPANGFNVSLNFANGMDWASWSSQSFPTSFKADCGGVAANHEDWTYFMLQNSEGAELTGFGAYAGSSLNMLHAPANNYFGFQLGSGANNYNAAENGFGGWFSYSGTFLVNGETIMSGNAAGIGDLAFELDCCPDYSIVRQWTAMDCSGNVSTCTQNITFGAGDSNAGQTTQNGGLINEGEREVSEVTVMPNPASDKASFNFKPINNAKTTLEIFDMTGSKVADIFVGEVEAGMTYRVEFDVQSLATGVYTYRLTNGGDVQVSRLIIGK